MRFTLSRNIVLAACSLLGANAFCASSDAFVEGLQVQLIDLQPDDGIAPSITFFGQSFATSSVALPAGWRGQVLVGQDQTGASAFDTVDSDSEWDFGGAIAILAPVVDGNGWDATTNAFSNWPDLPGSTSSELLFGGGFSLSAETRLVITGTASVDALAGGEAAISLNVGGLTSSAEQDEFLKVIATTGNAWKGDFSLVFTNTDSTPVFGGFDAVMSASTVPEPADAFLLGAGLALLGWASGRTRTGRRPAVAA